MARKPAANKKLREFKLFAIVVLLTAAPVLGTIAIVVSSTRPSLAYKSFPPGMKSGVLTLDWLAIYGIEDQCRKSGAVPAAYVDKAIRLRGYLSPHPYDASSDFLLVPDPGNWLHPAHEDDGVFVRLHEKASALPSTGNIVWAQGKLSISFDRTRSETPCYVDASAIYAEER